MKRLVIMVLTLMVMVTMIGCTTNDSETLEYSIVSEAELTESVLKAAEEIKMTGGHKIILDEEAQYVIIRLGERNTGGYEIKIDQVEEKEGKILIYYTEITPGRDEMVTEALTYPYRVLQIESKQNVEVIANEPRMRN